MGTKNKPGKYDCYANAHPDEPMFILLGRDPLAPELVEAWADERESQRGPSEKVDEARACANAMREWQKRGSSDVRIIVNGERREIPPSPVTYEQIVALAGMSGNPSMTWKLPLLGSGGTMSPGCTLVPSDGLVFNVCHTGNA
jgi:hypothetical protein